MRKQIGIIIGVLAFAQTTLAQKDSILLDNVEVVASMLHRNISSATNIQTIQKADLIDLGIDNVADAVKRFAGVSVRDYGGIGGMKTVSIHNLGTHHVAISYDGVTLSNTQAGQIDIGRYDTDNLSSISLSLGDEDQLMLAARQYVSAGVLALKSERPHFEANRTNHLKVNLTAGSFGYLSPSFRYSHRVGERTSVSFQGKMMRADGQYPYTLTNGRLKTREHRYNSDIQSWQGEVNLYHTFANASELDVKAYWYYSQRGLPGAVILYANPSEERMWDEDFFVQSVYRAHLHQRLQLEARLKYTHSWNKYRDVGSEYPSGEQVDIDRQDEYYGSATLGWNIAKGLDMSIAEDLSYNKLKNNVYVNTNYDVPLPTRLTSISALAMKWRINRLKINGSLGYTYAHEMVEAGNKPADKTRFTPSIALNYRLLAHIPLFFRAMWKNTFRVPTFNDLYYRRLGNVNLRPEIAHQYSTGLTWETHYRALRYLSFTVDGYYHDVRDKIVAFPSTYIWRMANYGKVDIWGVDMTMGAQVDIASRWNAKFSAAATWQQALDKTNTTSQTYNSMLPYTPKWSGNGSIVLSTPWLNIGYSVIMQGSRYSSAQNKLEYRMNAFWEHSLTLNREFQLKSFRLNLQAKVTNLTDQQYEIIQYYPMPGRQFTFSGTFYF